MAESSRLVEHRNVYSNDQLNNAVALPNYDTLNRENNDKNRRAYQQKTKQIRKGIIQELCKLGFGPTWITQLKRYPQHPWISNDLHDLCLTYFPTSEYLVCTEKGTQLKRSQVYRFLDHC